MTTEFSRTGKSPCPVWMSSSNGGVVNVIQRSHGIHCCCLLRFLLTLSLKINFYWYLMLDLWSSEKKIEQCSSVHYIKFQYCTVSTFLHLNISFSQPKTSKYTKTNHSNTKHPNILRYSPPAVLGWRVGDVWKMLEHWNNGWHITDVKWQMAF